MALLTKSKKTFLQMEKHFLVLTLTNQEKIPKMSNLLLLVGGFVEGGMVDGSVDKIKTKHFNNRKNTSFQFH